MKFISPLLLLVLLSSCAYFGGISKKDRANMDSMLGQDKAVVYRWLGPPTYTTSDGSDGEILCYVWERSRVTPGTAYSNGYGGVTYNPATVRTNSTTRMFYVHKDGKVYWWRIQ